MDGYRTPVSGQPEVKSRPNNCQVVPSRGQPLTRRDAVTGSTTNYTVQKITITRLYTRSASTESMCKRYKMVEVIEVIQYVHVGRG